MDTQETTTPLSDAAVDESQAAAPTETPTEGTPNTDEQPQEEHAPVEPTPDADGPRGEPEAASEPEEPAESDPTEGGLHGKVGGLHGKVGLDGDRLESILTEASKSLESDGKVLDIDLRNEMDAYIFQTQNRLDSGEMTAPEIYVATNKMVEYGRLFYAAKQTAAEAPPAILTTPREKLGQLVSEGQELLAGEGAFKLRSDFVTELTLAVANAKTALDRDDDFMVPTALLVLGPFLQRVKTESDENPGFGKNILEGASGDTVTMNFPSSLIIMLNQDKRVEFKPGLNEVPVELQAHRAIVGIGAKVYATLQPDEPLRESQVGEHGRTAIQQ